MKNKKRKRDATFLGMHAEAAGITSEALEKDDVHPVVEVSNGLVLDIYRKVLENERYGRPYPKARWVGWIRVIAGLSEDIPQSLVVESVTQLCKERDQLRRLRKDKEKTALDNASFVLNIDPVQQNDNAQMRQENYLDYEISKKEKHLHVLEIKILEQRMNLLKRGVRYNPKNVRERDERKDRRIRKLKDDLNCALLKLKDKDKTIQKLRSKLTFWKKKSKIKVPNDNEYELKLKKKIEVLESEVKLLNYKAAATDGEGCQRPALLEGGAFTHRVRRSVMELVSLEVATDKVPHVIQSVATHIFQCPLEMKEIPQRQTVLKITDEGHFIVKAMYADLVRQADHFGMHKDGTSRKKKKILGNTLNLSTNESLPLGFCTISSETADMITKTAQLELEEVALCGNTVIHSVIRKLTYVMSDRAANEKLSNRQLAQWKEEQLADADPNDKEAVAAVQSLYCMVHVLLGFHTYGVKQLDLLQKLYERTGVKFGRDGQVVYKREVAGQRTVRILADLLGPVPDEKNGQRERWLAYCRLNNRKSLIANYRDNRFNCLFETSAQVLHHRQDILEFFSGLETNNLKVKSARLDLQDEKIIAIISALAAIYFKVTGPYWDAMTSGHCNYLELHLYVQPMYHKICDWINEPTALLHAEDQPLFDDFPGQRNSPMFQSAMTAPSDIEYFKRCVTTILEGMRTCCEKQLSDFISGHLNKPATQAARDLVSGAPLHNLMSEQAFGTLDSSQQRRRNATLHYHTSLVLLKANRKRLNDWLSRKNEDEVQELFRAARKQGVLLRKSHQESVAATNQEIEQNLLSEAQKKKSKKKNNNKNNRGKENEPEVMSDASDVEWEQIEINPLPSGSSSGKDDWIAVAFDNGWFPGIVTNVEEDGTLQIDFLHPTSLPMQFRRPNPKDEVPVKRMYVFAGPLLPPVPTSGGRLYTLTQAPQVDEMYKMFKARYW